MPKEIVNEEFLYRYTRLQHSVDSLIGAAESSAAYEAYYAILAALQKCAGFQVIIF